MLLEEQILLTKSLSPLRGEAKKSDLHVELPPYIVLRLAGDHLYGKWLFTWLVLVMSLFVLCFAVLYSTRCLEGDLGLN